jgi:hypothetical protein
LVVTPPAATGNDFGRSEVASFSGSGFSGSGLSAVVALLTLAWVLTDVALTVFALLLAVLARLT